MSRNDAEFNLSICTAVVDYTCVKSLNCMSALSICLVPNVHCQRSHQLRPICTCVTDYTHSVSNTHRRCKELQEQNGFGVSQSLVLCLRNAFDITIRKTINPVPSQRRYHKLQQLEPRFVLQMQWCITHHIRVQYAETTLQCTE